MANNLWFAEIILEAFGCYFSFRKRLRFLSLFLAFKFCADVAGAILRDFDHVAFRWENYLARMVGYVLLSLLAMHSTGNALGAPDREIRRYVVLICLVAVCGLMAAHGSVPWTFAEVFGIEVWTNMLIGGVVVLALLCCEFELLKIQRPWSAVLFGIATIATSDAVVSKGLIHHWLAWEWASNLMSAGRIAGMLAWIYGLLRTNPEYFRLPLEQRAEPLVDEEIQYKAVM